jgi:hypothetical protein
VTKLTTEPLVLFYGNAKTPLVHIVPDARYPGMWRMAWPDGRLSDMANLSRIKDAAVAICERGPPARNRRRFIWKKDRSKTAVAASPMRRREVAARACHPSTLHKVESNVRT